MKVPRKHAPNPFQEGDLLADDIEDQGEAGETDPLELPPVPAEIAKLLVEESKKSKTQYQPFKW